jgi:hypothetical protein
MDLINISVTTNELVALWNLRHSKTGPFFQALSGLVSNIVPEKTEVKATFPSMPPSQGKFHYQVFGEKRSAKNAVDAFVDILKVFAVLEPTFAEKLSLLAPSTSRNHVARSPSEVYPKRPDLGENAREFAEDWYVGINIADREKCRILRLACDIYGLQFGKDIIF